MATNTKSAARALAEMVFNFGKFGPKDGQPGKDISDPSVSTVYLQWVLDNVGFLRPQQRTEIEQEIQRRRAARRGSPAAKPAATAVAVAPPPAPTSQAQSWVAATLKMDTNGMDAGDTLALTRRADGNWDYVSLTGHMAGNRGTLNNMGIANVIQSMKDASGQAMRAGSLDALKAMLGQAPAAEPEKSEPAPEEAPEKTEQKAKSHILPGEMMSEEQKKIDAQFEKIMKETEQSHIMINALAGSGKTTMLKHLAWKYGQKGQKWLYLVFNKKNQVEGKEKFPPFVEVKTTNGFLGEVLKVQEGRIPATNRMAEIASGKEDAKRVPEKIQALADGQKFNELFLTKAGLRREEDVDPDQYGDMAKSLKSLLRSMRYTFKEQALLLANLGKSFAVDPRKEDLRKAIEEVGDKYDIDWNLGEIKERISKYRDGVWKMKLLSHLKTLLGYDFMEKEFKKEIKEAAEWLLHQSLPGKTDHVHQHGNMEVPLHQFRDFNDDLWYCAIHADQIKWPHYDYVLADEVQDFNECQKIVLKKLHEAGAKIVAVGDPNQSIYRFRGADAKAFGNIGDTLKGLSKDKNVEHTLSDNFRSRPEIIKYVNNVTHVKNLRAGKKFKDGNEGTVTKEDVEYPQAFKQLADEKAGGKLKQTAFISRTNEPLVHAALKLLASGIPFVIVGKDIAGDLKKHIKKVMAMMSLRDEDSVASLAAKLTEHFDKENEFHGGKAAKKAYLQELGDTTKALTSCIAQFDPSVGGDMDESVSFRDWLKVDEYVEAWDFSEYYGRSRWGGGSYRRRDDDDDDGGSYGGNGGGSGKTIRGFKAWLDEKLGGLDVAEDERDLRKYKEKLEKENPVILTTAHRSKGLEFERVYILRDDQFPHPKAKRDEDLEQEANAKYVAYTRAMDELHIVKLEGQPGYKKK